MMSGVANCYFGQGMNWSGPNRKSSGPLTTRVIPAARAHRIGHAGRANERTEPDPTEPIDGRNQKKPDRMADAHKHILATNCWPKQCWPKTILANKNVGQNNFVAKQICWPTKIVGQKNVWPIFLAKHVFGQKKNWPTNVSANIC